MRTIENNYLFLNPKKAMEYYYSILNNAKYDLEYQLNYFYYVNEFVIRGILRYSTKNGTWTVIK